MVRFSRSYNNNNNTDNNIQQSEKMVKHKLNHYLSLEYVCPAWSKRLKLGLDEKDKHIIAHDSKYCLVGEAWGFTGKHAGYYIAPLIPFIGCWSCVQYGNDMGKLARNTAADLQSSDLEPIVTEFLKHWSEKHRSITEKLRKHKCH
ncbi:MAG: hypothetical protein WA421_15675 [Nitrososphaeraceae archaeon]